uniref:uncharacterized protein LOC122581731 n=1 Tax=Erigeron canadensis TaxID=72917 RepID=UPI001CB9550A|nr:uncharacterized protein LOC122581731 [Erigeron canadensis]
MDPKKMVVDLSSDDEDDDHKWLTKLLEEDDDDDVKNNNNKKDDGVIMVNENEKKIVKSLKVKLKVKECLLVDDDECVVLENDPNEKLEAKSKKDGVNEDDEIVVVSEKGQVACRDYPHSRHLCIKFPFSTTPDQSHCEQCYCYVCDSLAPCVYWGNGSATTDHCHATDKDDLWRLARENTRNVSKGVPPIKRPLSVDPQRLAPAMVPRSLDPIARPCLIQPQTPQRLATAMVSPQNPIASPNFQPSNFHNQNRSHVLASRHKLHTNLISQAMRRNRQNSYSGNQAQKQVLRKTASVGVTATANHASYGSYRIPFGDSSMQQNQNSYGSYCGPYRDTNRQQNQNYHGNGALSRPNKYLRMSQPNAVNTSAPNPPQNQSYTSLSVNQPSPCEAQFSMQSNPSFQSQVNTSPFPGNPLYQANLVTPSYLLPQLPSSQSGYVDPIQSNYPVPFSQVDSLSVSVSDYIQNSAQGTQPQSPLMNPNFQDNELKLPLNQDSVTLEGAMPASEPILGELCDNLADYQYDWIFDDQSVEPGRLLDNPGPNGLYDFSSDSTCINTGPIFDF